MTQLHKVRKVSTLELKYQGLTLGVKLEKTVFLKTLKKQGLFLSKNPRQRLK